LRERSQESALLRPRALVLCPLSAANALTHSHLCRYEQLLFKDHFGTCGEDLCFFRNDNPLAAWTATFTVEVVDVISHQVRHMYTWSSITLEPGEIQWFDVDLSWVDQNQEFVRRIPSPPQDVFSSAHLVARTQVVLQASPTSSSAIEFSNVLMFGPPKYLIENLPETNLTVQVVNSDSVEVKDENGALALYVVLTSSAQGRFAENGFALMPGEVKVVQFIHFSAGGVGAGGGGEGEGEGEGERAGRLEGALKSSAMRVEDLATYAREPQNR
jgi:hypothetical protein